MINNLEKNNINKLINILRNINNDIYVVGHKDADMDSLCSSLAIVNLLKKLGKNSKALIENDDIKKIEYFNLNKYVTNKIENDNYTIILVDANSVDRIPNEFIKYYNNSNLKINIDHHMENSTNADYIVSVEEISSTCEIIYDIYEKSNIKLDKPTSELLFTGIVSDTKLFYNRMTKKHFQLLMN